jgi:capsular polysaccharide biosynthesis protein
LVKELTRVPIEATRLKSLIRNAAPGWARSVGRRLPAGLRTKIISMPRPDDRSGAVPKNSLSALVREAGWQLNAGEEKLVRRLDRLLKTRTSGDLAILCDGRSEPLAAAVAQRWPNQTVRAIPWEGGRAAEQPDEATTQELPAHRLPTPESQRHAILTAFGPFDVLVDAVGDCREESQLQRFRQTFFHLKPQGIYLLPTGRPVRTDNAESVVRFLARMIELKSQPRDEIDADPYDVAFAEALGTVIAEDGLILARCIQPAMPKLRDWEVDDVLERRPDLGRVLVQRPGVDFTPRGQLRANHPGFQKRFTALYHVPPVSLRAYVNVITAPHQVVMAQHILLPDSYRHHTHRRLTNRFLTEVGLRFARYPEDTQEATSLSGSYFYLGSEWPRHFGHLMTEQLSRLWAWPEAKARFPDLKALVSVPKGHQSLADFEVALLSAAGIDPADMEGSHGVVQVETLLAATPMLVNADYIHPDIAQVWRRVAEALLAEAPARDYPAKLFCSRRRRYKRACQNLEEVEDVFRGHGFAIVYPEDYPCSEQAAMFDRARVVAGFAGSALFNLAFCTSPKHVIMLSSESYTARNEYMISSVLGHHIDLIWCPPDMPHPGGKWSSKAFASGFRVDFERDGRYLEDVLLRTS